MNDSGEFVAPVNDDEDGLIDCSKVQKRKRVYQCSVCGAWRIDTRRKASHSGSSTGVDQ